VNFSKGVLRSRFDSLRTRKIFAGKGMGTHQREAGQGKKGESGELHLDFERTIKQDRLVVP
jgi:hypothetical protein